MSGWPLPRHWDWAKLDQGMAKIVKAHPGMEAMMRQPHAPKQTASDMSTDRNCCHPGKAKPYPGS